MIGRCPASRRSLSRSRRGSEKRGPRTRRREHREGEGSASGSGADECRRPRATCLDCPRRAIYVKQGEKAYCLSEEREKDDTGSARGTDMAASCAASITTRD